MTREERIGLGADVILAHVYTGDPRRAVEASVLAEDVLAGAGLFVMEAALNRAAEAIASLPSEALGLVGDDARGFWSLRDELLDQISRAQGGK